MQRRTAAVVALLALAAASTGVVFGGHATPADATATIGQTTSMSLTPDTPGAVGATVRYDVPSRVTDLTVTVPSGDTVVSTRGFTRASGNRYRWDGSTASPAVTLSEPANRSLAGSRALGARVDSGRSRPSTGGRSTSAARSAHANGTHPDGPTLGGGYSFVDTGSWAIAPVPQVGVNWQWRGGNVTLSRRATVDGEGIVGNAVAYLGPYTEYDRTAHGQRFRLIIPAAASMRESPSDVLDALASASGTLRVGARDLVVRLIAAPTSVDWGAAGLEYGGSDAWVQANSRLDSPDDVWVHEYVHTRQAYTPTNATRWTIEATAEYEAGLLALDAGRIDYRSFRNYLDRGTRSPYATATLADTGTWRPPANYLKGALVLDALDRRIRGASNEMRALGDVIRRLNARDGPVTRGAFLDAVGAAGGSSAREAARRYTETSAAPSTVSRARHRALFGHGPALSYALDHGALTVRGPWRNTTLTAAANAGAGTGDAPAKGSTGESGTTNGSGGNGSAPAVTVVPGETLAVNATVRNAGDRAGPYRVTLSRNGTTVAATNGTVAAGGTARIALAHRVETTGTYSLALGTRRVRIAAVPPATPAVRSLTANRTAVNASEAVAVTATVANSADQPANATYDVRVDGRTRRTWTPHLEPNGTRHATFVVRFDSGGTHAVRVGSRNVTVAVSGGGGLAPGVPAVPGFGVGAGLLGGVLAVALAAVTRHRRDAS